MTVKRILLNVRYLTPLVFVLLGVSNLVLCAVFFLRDNQKSVDLDQETYIRITNIVFSVSVACSNQIKSVQRQMRSYVNLQIGSPLIRTNSNVRSALSPDFSPSSVSFNTNNALPSIDMPFFVFRSGSYHGISLNGRYYQVGDNFGYGEITSIYNEMVYTTDYRIRRVDSSPPSPPSLLQDDRRVFYAAMRGDYPDYDYDLRLRQYEREFERGVSTRSNQ